MSFFLTKAILLRACLQKDRKRKKGNIVAVVMIQKYLSPRRQRKYVLQIVFHFLCEPYPLWKEIEVIVPFRNQPRGTLWCRCRSHYF